MLKVIDGKKSCSGVQLWDIIEQWFTDNRGNSIATENAMNELETLLLSS